MSRYTRITFPVITGAIKGDTLAMEQILNHYKGYIYKLSVDKLYDYLGNERLTIDSQLQKILELHLIVAVLKFQIRK